MIKESTPRTILAFLLGAAAGAAAALLFAPKAGEELRDDIAEAVNDGVNQVSVKGKVIKSQAEKLVGRAQDQVQGAIAAGENAYSRAKNA
jgi:gas vesicle protein